MKTLFYWTRDERMGIALLCLMLIIGQIFVTYGLPWWFPPRMISEVDAHAFLKKVDSVTHSSVKVSLSAQLNPNQVTVEELVASGISRRIANTIVNYRTKVKPYAKMEDFKKIYGMSPEVYEKLAAVMVFNQPIAQNINTTPQKNEKNTNPQTLDFSRFFFDPNSLSKDSLILLGIPPHLAQTIIKYRSKGGRFDQPTDLARIYHFPPALADTLAPWVKIPSVDQLIKPTSQNKLPEQPILIEVDINLADAQQWASLKGIGPVLSERIVRFREKLGGFVAIDQVAETYGLPDSTFQNIHHQLIYSPLAEKIPINWVSFDTLSQHPYINYKEARILLNYRRNHGPFSQFEDLTKIRGIKPSVFQRLRPYLDFSKKKQSD